MSSLSRVIALVAVALAVLAACAPGGQPAAPSVPATATSAAGASGRATSTPTGRQVAERTPTSGEDAVATPEVKANNTPTPVVGLAPGLSISTFVEDAIMPISMAFAPDGRLFFIEYLKGEIRIAHPDGTLQEQPFAKPSARIWKEQGVLGIAFDPDFPTNRWVYVYYTQARGSDNDKAADNRVVRYTEVDGVGTERTNIFPNLPVGVCCHNGGRIAFGPDGKLYVTVGDVNDDDKAQNPNRLHGKILRINRDGSTPDDNPVEGSPVFALGFRNPFGLAFHPKTGLPYISENGEVGHDEINRVVPNGNYGNPKYDGVVNQPGFQDPIWESGVGRIAPSGAAFYTGDRMPEYKGDFFFCAFNTGDLTRMRFGSPDYDRIEQHEVIYRGCHLDIVDGPDGALYFSTFRGILRLGR